VKTASEEPRLSRAQHPTMSAAADEHYRQTEVQNEFEVLAANLKAKLRKEISKLKKLRANLQKDLTDHGNPEEHKRLGDLLLANVASAERNGSKVIVRDYYAEGLPAIELDVDENKSLPELANEAFSRYAKAKRAVAEIARRAVELDLELVGLGEKQLALDKAIASGNQAPLASFEDRKKKETSNRKKQKASTALPGMRRYQTSDGYEVLVGRTARDNDNLTFRLARPSDLWLHAGDYPGSHVIIRNPNRKEIPQRTVIEAAELAAKFSQAGKDSKVAIHYTPRKFLSKPKGAAPGLVRMSSFKTITVEPGDKIERIK
jgi:predicted ribosome quality control (RQC) complex YloA/Tae2 family protein